MTERFNEASRISYALLFALFALQWDGAGRLASVPWWGIVLLSLTPLVVAFLVELVLIAVQAIALVWRR